MGIKNSYHMVDKKEWTVALMEHRIKFIVDNLPQDFLEECIENMITNNDVLYLNKDEILRFLNDNKFEKPEIKFKDRFIHILEFGLGELNSMRKDIISILLIPIVFLFVTLSFMVHNIYMILIPFSVILSKEIYNSMVFKWEDIDLSKEDKDIEVNCGKYHPKTNKIICHPSCKDNNFVVWHEIGHSIIEQYNIDERIAEEVDTKFRKAVEKYWINEFIAGNIGKTMINEDWAEYTK